MSETPLVGPPEDAGDSDAPGEDGLPLSSLRGAGPQNAVAPGVDPAEPPPGGDPTQSAPSGDPGGSASDLGSESDPGSLGDSGSATTSSDPLPDPSGS